MKYRLIYVGLILLFCTNSIAQIRYNTKRNSDQVSISYSNPQEYEIAEIKVEGSKFLEEIALVSISGLQVGDKVKIPGDKITSAIKKLWKQGLIGDIQIFASKVEGNKIYLTISLTERPRLSRFRFDGVSKTQETEIREKINLIRGRVVTDAITKNAELAIKKYFHEKGYLNTEVDITLRPDSIISNSTLLEVKVNKNQKVKITDVKITGNEYFSEGKLKRKLKNTGEKARVKIISGLIAKTVGIFDKRIEKRNENPMEFLNRTMKLNVFKSSKFIKNDYLDDKESLIAFYNSKGYRDAEILSDSIYRHDNKSVDIDININPGRKYYFRNINWTGNYIYSSDQLDKILAVNGGDVYNLDLIEKKLNFNPNGPDISSLYMDDGYLFFSVNPVETNIDGDSVDVEMRIYEGAQATINKVYVTGNDRTNDHVVLREIRTLPGQKFSRSQLIRTQRELSQLGYFDPESVNPVPKPNPQDETVDIEWQLVERPSDQIELSGGWGGNFGFIGTLGLTFNNFSLRNIPHFDKWRPLPIGDGQKLSLRLQANGRRFQSYSLSFQEPWIGGKKPNNFGVSFNYSVQRSIDPRTNVTFSSTKVSGVTVSLGRRVQWPDDFFTVSNSVSYLQYALASSFDSQNTTLGFNNGTANNITFNTTIARNSIDSPMYPRQGSSISLNVALTPPYSKWRDLDYETAENIEKFKWVEYHKWMFDAKYYMKLAGNLVLESRAHMGFIGSYSSEAGIGPFERFQLGGDGLSGGNFLLGNETIGLRGYQNNSINPRDEVNQINGGTIFNKFVFELRYPISLNPSATIYVHTFAEAGNNWNQASEYNPNKLFRSAGFGARIFMPAFGLLGIDWAYGFDNGFNTNQKSGAQVHFSIGQLLR